MDILFDNLFNSIKRTIEPHPVWDTAWSGRKQIAASVDPDIVNCTKHLVVLRSHETLKTTTSNGRKMVFLGTCNGSILIYQRIPESSEVLHVYAVNRVWNDFFIYNDYHGVVSMKKPSLKYSLSRDDLNNILNFVKDIS